jgi:GNAT superfamily N-acetyltransferase
MRQKLASDKLQLRPAGEQDRPFVESVYLETQRWIIERFFGWRGDDFEHATFRDKFYRERDSSIIVADGSPVGWIAVERNGKTIHLDGIYLMTQAQRKGIGTTLLRRLLAEAREAGSNPCAEFFNNEAARQCVFHKLQHCDESPTTGPTRSQRT